MGLPTYCSIQLRKHPSGSQSALDAESMIYHFIGRDVAATTVSPLELPEKAGGRNCNPAHSETRTSVGISVGGGKKVGKEILLVLQHSTCL